MSVKYSQKGKKKKKGMETISKKVKGIGSVENNQGIRFSEGKEKDNGKMWYLKK